MNIIGDTIIDHDIHLKQKQNPEENIPAYDLLSETLRPGGAANVAYQLKNFSGNLTFYSSVNKEAREILEYNSICTANTTSQEQDNPKKYRYHINGNYFKRLDKDVTCKPITARIKDDGINLIADYNKGSIDEHILKKETILNAIVDAKPPRIPYYMGCKALKLNMKEALEFTGETDIFKIIKTLAKYSDNIIITQGNKDTIIYSEKTIASIKTNPQTLKNIVGAGDAFLAFLGLHVEAGLTIYEASLKAAKASEAYVSITRGKELFPYMLTADKMIKPDILSFRDFKLVFTNGCFDLLHAGHLDSLQFAKNQGEKLLVAINSDSSVKRLKGDDRPIMPLEHRLKMLAALECVDFVTVFEENTPLEVIKSCRPDIIVKGSPYKKEDVVGYGLAEIMICPRTLNYSTTSIMNTEIKSNNK